MMAAQWLKAASRTGGALATRPLRSCSVTVCTSDPLRPSSWTICQLDVRGRTQINFCHFSDLAAGRRKIVTARTVRGKSAVLKMPSEDIGPTWGDWSDAASCVDLNTNT